ncbi:hypothetical protein BGZ59_002654, partial [Podila verticillata]
MDNKWAGTSKDSAGEIDSNSSNATLAFCSMVPNRQEDVGSASNSDPPPSCSPSTRKRIGYSGEKSALVTHSLENKRRRLQDKGWDAQTTALVINSPDLQRKQKQYEPIQDRYIRWALEQGADPTVPDAAQLLNFLASGVTLQKWKSGTVNNYKTAITHMYKDKSVFNDPDFKSFFQVIKATDIKDMAELNVDIQPVINFFKAKGCNKSLDNTTLMHKLCWLLGVCGFMRPSDILQVDLSHPKFQLDAVACILPIVFLKEKHGGRRIRKFTAIKSHDDPLICPVQAITEYLRRITPHEIMVPHPLDPKVLYRPLIRD